MIRELSIGPGAPVLAEVLQGASPGARRLKQAALVALGVAAITAAARISIPLEPVPVTMQTLAVLSIGGAYGTRLGLATVLLWLLIGAAGGNVFADLAPGMKGLTYIVGPTGGYLFGFALAVAALGFLARRGWDRSVGAMAAAMMIGNALIYAPGLFWLGRLYGFDAPILEWGLYPFLIGDAIKLALAALVFPFAWRAVGAARA